MTLLILLYALVKYRLWHNCPTVHRLERHHFATWATPIVRWIQAPSIAAAVRPQP